MERIRVLIVDDSVVFRSQIRQALESVPQIEVVDYASNGKLALQKKQQKPVEVVTLDLEMPELDGIRTLEEMRRLEIRAKVIVFSSSSKRGAQSTLQALAAGASDFLAKPTAEGVSPAEVIAKELIPKILQFEPLPPLVSPVIPVARPRPARMDWANFEPSAVVIASSTGGPQALANLFENFKSSSCPILIVQHMPPVFTASLAERLERISGMRAREGVDNELIAPNTVYIAPGDYHMFVKDGPEGPCIGLDKGAQLHSVRPAADRLFESAAKYYGSKLLGLVLTGMGYDGLAGAKTIKERGGAILIQNRQSCTVFGMPGAVYQEGAYDAIGNIEDLRRMLMTLVQLKPIKAAS